MRALPRLRRSPLAAAVRDRISQKKGQRQQALDACASRQGGRAAFSISRDSTVRSAGALGASLGTGSPRARRSPGAAESDGCQPKSRDAGADAPADGTSAGLPARGSDWTRGRAASGCVSVCMFLSVRLRGRRLRTRWLGALGLCSRHLRRRRLHGTPRGRRDLPALAARRRAALGAWSRRRKQLHEHGFGIRRHGRRNRRRRHAAPDQASDAHMQGAGQQGRDPRRCAPAARIPAIPAQAVDMAGGKHRDHLQYSTDKPDSTGDRG